MNYSSLLKKIFFHAGVYGLIRKLFPNKKVAILRYHAVIEEEKNFYTSPAIALSPAEFEKQVQYLAARYKIISLDEVISSLRNQQKLPNNSLVFTFDDGYADNFEAARILQKYSGTGTFYITALPVLRKNRFWLAEVTYLILKTEKPSLQITSKDGRHQFTLNDTESRWKAIREIIRIIKSNNGDVRDEILSQLYDALGETKLFNEIEELMLTKDRVGEMIRMGMTIGSHTLTHLNLPNAEREDAIKEITESKKVLEETFAVAMKHFSYPNSGPYDYYNERIREYVIDAGYESATTSYSGFVDENSDLFALRRVRTVADVVDVVHALEWDRLFSS